jgi:hypothetical protein
MCTTHYPLQGYMVHKFHLCLQAVIGALKDFYDGKQAERAKPQLDQCVGEGSEITCCSRARGY